MKVSLRSAAEEIALLPASRAGHRDMAPAQDIAAVRRRLANLVNDPENASAIRLFLHSQSATGMLHRQSMGWTEEGLLGQAGNKHMYGHWGIGYSPQDIAKNPT